MKCRECPYHLLCHSGRLDVYTQMTLCIGCGRITFITMDDVEVVHTFKCEQRTVLPKYRSHLHKVHELPKNNHAHTITEMRVKDTGPGTQNELRIVEVCYACRPDDYLRGYKLTIHDEDQLRKVKEESKPNLLGLRTKTNT